MALPSFGEPKTSSGEPKTKPVKSLYPEDSQGLQQIIEGILGSVERQEGIRRVYQTFDLAAPRHADKLTTAALRPVDRDKR